MAGPGLAGIVGRPAASLPGFVYSPAMKSSQQVWTRAALDAFLKTPAKAIPGNRMPFAGLPSDADRAALIDYLAAPMATRR